MNDFQDRLQAAIQRGQQRRQSREQEAQRKALTEEELKGLHTKYRLSLSEHIERCVESVANQFPGFRYETLYGEKGWGAACNRDDLTVDRTRIRQNKFSRLEMTIRPYSTYHVLELTGKATIRNREVFNRTNYELLQDVDADAFRSIIDAWVIEFAEIYAASL
ncbi:MAG: hypothetical protein R3E01_09070 [Pirellulaceae bacterium]|nr:hypothetical protein [Planctomycetales bacterium]MCA9264608.1 hypothetical protein [Planctomycetales bacterium]